jgi:hypothetical protein
MLDRDCETPREKKSRSSKRGLNESRGFGLSNPTVLPKRLDVILRLDPQFYRLARQFSVKRQDLPSSAVKFRPELA